MPLIGGAWHARCVPLVFTAYASVLNIGHSRGRRRLRFILRQLVSIHAPVWGGDVAPLGETRDLDVFESTPPAWGATFGVNWRYSLNMVSIHAPRVGGDSATG